MTTDQAMMTLPVICDLCQFETVSKTKLFKHLVEAHGFARKGKPLKVVLLLGWLSNILEDQEDWLNDHQHLSYDVVDPTSVLVENALFAAYHQIENPDLKQPCYDRPKGYSRGSGIAQRTSLLYSSEPTCHGLCDTFCFQLQSWGNFYEGGKEGWIRKMNEILPSSVRIIHAYQLNSSAATNFHAEMDCSQRRYEYLVPLDIIMPLNIVKPPEELITRQKKQSSVLLDENVSNTIPGRGVMDKSFPLETAEGQTRVAYFRKLKDIFKQLGGKYRKKFHNFVTAGAEPMDGNITHRVDRIFHKEILNTQGRNWVVFSISGDVLLRGQVRKLLGLAVAVALGFLPPSYLEVTLDTKRVIEVPSFPGFPLYLAECRYCLWEAKYTEYRLDPRRTDIGVTPLMQEWTRNIHHQIISHAEKVFPPSWLQSFQQNCEAIYSRFCKIEANLQRSSIILKDLFEENFAFPSNLTDEIMEVEVSATVADSPTITSSPSPSNSLRAKETSSEDDEEGSNEVDKNLMTGNKRTANLELFTHRVATLQFLSIPSDKEDVPSVYRQVLTLLREADRSKLWPASSTGRQMVIDGETLVELGGRGGSFSVGALPAPLPQPKGNQYFAELMMACFQLERLLCPHRPPSSTIAINRHAQFLPHRDTGAGTGQKRSLIVALGMFTGGEIVVNHEVHDIRYQPLEFDGWQHLHYTLPFHGERYSLVWFTPIGITDEDLWWWK